MLSNSELQAVVRKCGEQKEKHDYATARQYWWNGGENDINDMLQEAERATEEVKQWILKKLRKAKERNGGWKCN